MEKDEIKKDEIRIISTKQANKGRRKLSGLNKWLPTRSTNDKEWNQTMDERV